MGQEVICTGEGRRVALNLLTETVPSLGAVGDQTSVARWLADALVHTVASRCAVELEVAGATRLVANAERAVEGSRSPDLRAGEVVRCVLLGPSGRIGRATIGFPVGTTLAPEDDEALEGLASAVAAVLDAVGRGAPPRRFADVLEASFFPRILPSAPWFELAGRYDAATAGIDVGGDWYDGQLLADGTLAVSVGDVAGHGVEAAARMAELRGATVALRHVERNPGDLLAVLHDVVAGRSTFATAVCMRIRRDGAVRWASAGHLPPVVRRASGSVEVWWRPTSPPLGIGGAVTVATNEDRLADGDVLVLYTDGLVERRSEPIDAGVNRLAEVLAAQVPESARAITTTLVDELVGSAPERDDVAVLVVRWCPPSGLRRLADTR